MKKGIRLIIAIVLCISIVGCANNSKSSNKGEENGNSGLKTNTEVKDILESKGFKSDCSENEEGKVDSFSKNHESGQVFSIYGSYESWGLAYQYDDNIIFVDDKKIVAGDGDKDEVYENYEKAIKELKLSKEEIVSFLKNEKNKYEKGVKDDLTKHKYYKAGTYEIGKDINEGEYLIIASGKPSDAEFEVASTSYDSSETEVFSIDSSFKNSYITVKNGQFLKVKNAYIFSVDDRPTLNLQNNGVFKVGIDLEAGIYNVHPRGDSAYYEIMTLDEDGKFDVGSVDYGFTDDIQIKVNDGEYLDISNVTITKVE